LPATGTAQILARMTVIEVIQRSTEFLARKGVESPRLQAELLLGHLLHVPRMKLYLDFERVLTAAETDHFRELIRRRGGREPLQHIVGSISFCGLEMAVNRHVLVPRPETELLAESAWTYLNQRVGGAGAGPRVLDFGTGSGCLAITLGVKVPGARVTALDVSPEALEVARGNAERHGVAERIEFVQGDSLANVAAGERFDLVVSNPPYIPTAEIASLEPEVRDYDPRAALDGGVDGLGFYRRLAAEAGARLAAGGRMMLEFGDGQAETVSAIVSEQKWIVERVVEDYTQRPRILICAK
jgi:release factor glutamine methyltransferase